MSETNIIDSYIEQLLIYRKNLAILLQQVALYGGESYGPLDKLNQIDYQRKMIKIIKEYLISRGQYISDQPTDYDHTRSQNRASNYIDYVANENYTDDLTCWYINIRRVDETTKFLREIWNSSVHQSLIDDGEIHYHKMMVQTLAKDAMIKWMYSKQPSTLGELILSKSVYPGKFFTHYSDYYVKSLSKFRNLKKPKKIVQMPEISSILKGFNDISKLKMHFHPEHLTSNSSWSKFSGHQTFFTLGVIDRQEKDVVYAIPYLIATMTDGTINSMNRANLWSRRMEMYPSLLEPFKLMESEALPTRSEVKKIKQLSADQLKQAFLDILIEQGVNHFHSPDSKDVLISDCMFGGKKISIAIMINQINDIDALLSNNGLLDYFRIKYVFEMDVDIVVFQSLEEKISSLGILRSLSTNFARPKPFIILDGYTTLRILRAYGKCGFKPSTVKEISSD